MASDDVWAVGGGLPPPGSSAAFEYQSVDWDGVSWRDVTNPRTGVLYAVGASSRSDAWAVGFGFDSLGSSTGTRTLSYTACYVNCDGSSAAPALNVADFTCFLNRFANADPRANCDGSVTDPVLNVQDFACFLNRFTLGCS